MSELLILCGCWRKDSVDRPGRIRFGRFFRKSDGVWVQRFRCESCFRTYSEATDDICFKQHKRPVNPILANFLVSGISQRRLAVILKLNRKTVVRKFIFTGRLAKLSRKKYGKRKDERSLARAKLFKTVQNLVTKDVLIESDENPHYQKDVERFFPNACYLRHKGQRSSIAGQGELKKVRFDPLFSLNHTCAMLRANINRLIRKTWCTTKKKERLDLHLALYAVFHNENLKKKPKTRTTVSAQCCLPAAPISSSLE